MESRPRPSQWTSGFHFKIDECSYTQVYKGFGRRFSKWSLGSGLCPRLGHPLHTTVRIAYPRLVGHSKHMNIFKCKAASLERPNDQRWKVVGWHVSFMNIPHGRGQRRNDKRVIGEPQKRQQYCDHCYIALRSSDNATTNGDLYL